MSKTVGKTVGYGLRCSMFCVDHLPRRLSATEKRDVVAITVESHPWHAWFDDECDDEDSFDGHTLGSVAVMKGLVTRGLA